MDVTCENRRLTRKTARLTLIGCACLLVSVGLSFAETGQTPAVEAGDQSAQPVAPNSTLEPMSPRSYDPSGRRDPFVPVLQQLGVGPIDPSLPPLQRVGLTEMNLIAVVWGAYGNTAMVQTPDGNGYTVRRGTRIGPNNGVVSAVTEKGIVVQERFTDVYGSKQEREYVKLLHPKEGVE
ncbi:MAG: pilus assembly protein PilP [Nitrospirae bacterium]|nr:pilus assembly protein PilP [Nitrospirota bacterium]